MERKTVNFGKFDLAESEVAYVILGNTVYFTQTRGVFSSINGAERIVSSISHKEVINWDEYIWVDIQTTPRYSKYDLCQLVFDNSQSVKEWKTVKVPSNVLKLLLL